jgi:hypothetical protein
LIKKDIWIISVVNDHDPAAVRLVTHPVADKLKDVDFWFVPAIDLNSFGNSSIAFFEPGSSTSVDPEYPDFW